MIKFLGFETEEEAVSYQKENGGLLSSKYDNNPISEYIMAVDLGGLNSEKYPYCLTWVEI